MVVHLCRNWRVCDICKVRQVDHVSTAEALEAVKWDEAYKRPLLITKAAMEKISGKMGPFGVASEECKKMLQMVCNEVDAEMSRTKQQSMKAAWALEACLLRAM